MSKHLTPERRKVVIFAASIAVISAGTMPLVGRHPSVAIVWMCVLAVALVYVVMQLVRIKKTERLRRSGR